MLRDALGRVLMVRKRGTGNWMNPGGKPEEGESPAQCAAREVAEELGVILSPGALEPLGRYRAPAANEAGHVVLADVFTWREPVRTTVEPAAEIEALRWVGPGDLDDPSLAPLFTEAIAPRLAWA